MKLFALPLALLVLAFGIQAEPTLILVRGKIYTGDPAKPWAEAVAMERARISAVGSNDTIRALAGGVTRVIDLGGRLVVPGLNDAHTHPGGSAPMFRVDLGFDPAWEDMSIALAAAADETPASRWIGATIGPSIINNANINSETLEMIAPGRKVWLSAWTGHGAIASRAALDALSVDRNAPDPEGGWYGRDASGRVDGRMFEYAQYPLERKLAEMATDDDLRASVQAFSDEAVSYGITSVQAMPIVGERRFLDALKSSGVPLRVRVIRFLPPLTPDDRTPVDGYKWLLDGTPIERNAAMRSPYPNGGGTGRENFSFDRVQRFVKEAVDRNQQILFHVAGDKSIETALRALDRVRGAKRPRVEHADGLQRTMFTLAKKVGAVAVVNPSHMELRNSFPANGDFQLASAFVREGIPVAIGSDGPLNPWLNFLLITHRQQQPNESLTREQALAAYTAGSAFAEMKEKEKGTIAVGKLADLAVLSQDIFEVEPPLLPETRSVLTVIDGKIVYSALP